LFPALERLEEFKKVATPEERARSCRPVAV